MIKVLVVGGAGYIGSHVTRCLLDNGFSVTVYDNLSTGCKENIFTGSEFVQGDILDFPQLIKVMEQGFDGLVHLAALKSVGESMSFPEKYSLNNITGTLNLLNAASQTGVQNIVFSSSAAIYGEPQYCPIDEKHRKSPQNYYGFTKLEIERFLEWYDRIKGMRFAALRYFNAAGYDVEGRVTGLEKNPANLLPIIMETASGKRSQLEVFGDDYDTPDGTCIRDYIHVSDLANAHLLALKYLHRENKSGFFNLGSETGTSVLEMINSAREITGKEIPVKIAGRRVGDPPNLIASSSFAQKELGWKAENSQVDTLIQSAWGVYKNHFKISD
ncbi:UDP-glucose 4-epimerase [Chitinispirillum alkaliphilum]|nr:UDP-glucose 4-epimerase [Chitinispirillum alkaliphilum]